MALNPDRFAEFFVDLYGFSPFPWQNRLAAQVADGVWPSCIALPTASGKTACIDIAVFALACQANRPVGRRTAPRRVFFVVDRRVIVDEAYERAHRLAERLGRAETGILKEVAEGLRDIAQDPVASPLEVCQLRGGIYRDETWVRSPLQATVVASTVDQVGSRLLFRGYGVSDSAKPIHAGIVGNDSLIILDEAHCAEPFRQTLAAVSRYRSDCWAEEPIGLPFQFMEMSATPRNGATAFRLDKEDDLHPDLSRRHRAQKLAKLVPPVSGAKGKNAAPKLAQCLCDEAESLASSEAAPKAIAVIVNRVRTAKLVCEKLAKKHAGSVHLMIGRMRPVDRDELTKRLQRLFCSGARRADLGEPQFVIATQCLEVGADFDFDAMVCECASLDALRQRFGRLNRMGRDIQAQAAIVVAEQDQAGKKPDPIYGEALSRTWSWLMDNSTDGYVDFAIAAMDSLYSSATSADPELAPKLRAPAPSAPVLLPAHLDCWCQTSPMPAPDPDVSLFLHGPERSQPEVQICWRADLPEVLDEDAWTQAVSLCPPASIECLAVPLWLMKQWLFSAELDADSLTDVLGGESPELEEPRPNGWRQALRWRGPEGSKLIREIADIAVGDTIVLPVSAGGWETFGHVPDAPNEFSDRKRLDTGELVALDIGSRAFRSCHGKAILRLHPAIWPMEEALADLRAWASDPEDTRTLKDLRGMLASAALAVGDVALQNVLKELADPGNGLVWGRYSGVGAVLTSKRRVVTVAGTMYDDSDDSTSTVDRELPVPLADHLAGVAIWAARFSGELGSLSDAMALAGRFHDLGKADPRFQAYLRQSSMPDAQLWAKHPRAPMSFEEHRRACERSGRPEGWRHELLSTALLQDRVSPDFLGRELLLHLLASHHGNCRPFAPAIADPEPVAVSVRADGSTLNGHTDGLLTASSATGLARLDSGVSERFWRLVRRHGWWGLAYFEGMVRLADWRQSSDEAGNAPLTLTAAIDLSACMTVSSLPRKPTQSELLLPGIDGGNPLGFLAALGTLRTLSFCWADRNVRMSWSQHAGAWRPVLHIDGSVDETALLTALLDTLTVPFDEHPVAIVTQPQSPDSVRQLFIAVTKSASAGNTRTVDWLSCLCSDHGEEEGSRLQVVRRDYFVGNLRSIIEGTKRVHLRRTLFSLWDYADCLDNQSLHWDPSEDRRYALQWHQPSGDPTRKKHGGMLGANRLALEALPLHPVIVTSGSTQTVGFTGSTSTNTRWTWPIWGVAMELDSVATLLRHPILQQERPDLEALRQAGVVAACRTRRILVEKTPNLTPAIVLSQ